jgi:hypothetical protein
LGNPAGIASRAMAAIAAASTARPRQASGPAAGLGVRRGIMTAAARDNR